MRNSWRWRRRAWQPNRAGGRGTRRRRRGRWRPTAQVCRRNCGRRDWRRPGRAAGARRQRAAEILAEAKEARAAAERDRELLTRLLDAGGTRETGAYRRKRPDVMEVVEVKPDEEFAAAFRAWGLDMDRTPPPQAAAQL